MKEHVRACFKENRERYTELAIQLTQDLVAAVTVNAGRARLDECPGQEVPGEETRAIEVIRPFLDKLGVAYKEYALDLRRANLIATLGEGEKSLCVGCHTDVVPPGDGWDTPPYKTHLKDGFLYGRGVLDDKGPLASCLVAMQLLIDAGVKLNGSFQLAAIASEEFREAGEQDPGIDYLIKNGFLKPDMAIIPDIGENMRGIDVAEKGRAQIDLISIGVQAHGSTPDRGLNAINQMARFLVALEKHTFGYVEHPVLGHPTVNVGVIRGGAAANIVPGECRVTIDIRYVPGQTRDSIVDELKGICDLVGGKWRFEYGDLSLPHSIDSEHELVKVVQSNAISIIGVKPLTFGMGGGTFAKTFNLGGIPAIGYGPGDDADFHVANEKIEVEQLVQFAEILACTAIDLLGVKAR